MHIFVLIEEKNCSLQTSPLRLTPTIESIFEDPFHLLPTHLKMHLLFAPTTIPILHTHINKILFFYSIPPTRTHFLSLPSLTLN
jgi:hypothetical protein